MLVNHGQSSFSPLKLEKNADICPIVYINIIGHMVEDTLQVLT